MVSQYLLSFVSNNGIDCFPNIGMGGEFISIQVIDTLLNYLPLLIDFCFSHLFIRSLELRFIMHCLKPFHLSLSFVSGTLI